VEDSVFVESLLQRIVQKHDAGEVIQPEDIMERISNDPVYDVIRNLCREIGVALPDPEPVEEAVDAPVKAPVVPKYRMSTETAEKARKRMKRAVHGYLNTVLSFYEQKRRPAFAWLNANNDNRRTLHAGLHCDVGLGKSTEGIAMVANYIAKAKTEGYPHRVLWLVPHHALSAEAFKGMVAAGVEVEVWRGRDADDPNSTDPKTGNPYQMCRDTEAVNDANAVGAEVDKTVCGTLTGAHCPFLATCAYKAQRDACETADVVIAAHNVLFTPLARSVLDGVGLVIVDEGFWSKGIFGDRDISLHALSADLVSYPVLEKHAPDITATAWLEDLCKTVTKEALSLNEHDFLTAAQLGGITENDAERAARLEYRRKVDVQMWPGMPPVDRKAAKDSAVINGSLARRAAMWKTIAGILSGDVRHAGRLQKSSPVNKSGITPLLVLRSRHDIARQIIELPVLILDATYQREIVREFFPNAREITPHVRATTPNMIIRHIVGWRKEGRLIGGFAKSTLCISNSDNTKTKAKKAAKIAKLRKFVRLHTGDGTSLVITYQDLEKDFAEIRGCTTVHFNNITGLDRFGKVDAIFVIGRTLPNSEDTRRMALSLFGRVVPAEDAVETPAGVLMDDGTGTEIIGRAYTNEHLETIRWACADAEVIQAAGRGRGVNRTEDNPLRVFLMTDSVVPFAVRSVEAWADAEPTCLDEMWMAGGVLFSPSDAATMYPDLFANEESAKKALQRIHTGTILYKIFIEDCPRVAGADITYQPSGARRKKRQAVVPADRIDEFRTRLEAIHGPLALFKAVIRKPVRPEFVIDLTEENPTPVLVVQRDEAVNYEIEPLWASEEDHKTEPNPSEVPPQSHLSKLIAKINRMTFDI
jgi:putative DNA primase/helicase